ncbi:dolichyl-phosphate mannose synthase [Bacteroidia bacterium]|nr:dolichyl-phosphate mannose synthase [Bacteroidia bacterium]
MVLLIPAYNPDLRLIELLKQVEFEHKVIVNDGSKEECTPVFTECRLSGCDLISYSINRGKGYALKMGMQHILSKYPDESIVTADADGQHLPVDILRVGNCTAETNDFVLGVRDFSEPGVPPKSKTGNTVSSWLFKLMTGKTCRDTQTGLRGIPSRLINKCLSIGGDRFDYEMNMLMTLADSEEIKQVKIETVYIDENKTTSYRPVVDSLRIARVFLKYTLSSVMSFLIDYVLFLVIHFLSSGNILLSTIFARLCSGVFNFNMNARFVFENKADIIHLIKYAVLFICQMLASWLLVSLLDGTHLIPVAITKPVVDGSLFFISFLIQKRVIFVNK